MSDPFTPLKHKIDEARRSLHPHAKHKATKAGVNYGMKVGLDLVSGVAVGTLIGYGLDVWLGTLPILMLLGLCFGTAAGIKLMMESAQRAAQAVEEEENTDHGR